jgi:hypothetical protein
MPESGQNVEAYVHALQALDTMSNQELIKSLEDRNEELRKKLLGLELRRERWEAVCARVKDIVPSYYICDMEIQIDKPAENIKIDFDPADNKAELSE